MNERIKELRTSLGMTMKDFGVSIGLSISGVSDVEKGRTPVQDRHIKLILAAFPSVSEAWLRDGVGDMFVKGAPNRQYGLDDVCNEVLTLYASMTPDQQRVIMDFVDDLVEKLHAKKANPLTEEERIEKQVEEYRQALLAEARQGSRPSEPSSSAG